MRRNKHARKVSAEPAGPVSLFRRPIRKRSGGGMGMAGHHPIPPFRGFTSGIVGGMRRNGGIDP